MTTIRDMDIPLRANNEATEFKPTTAFSPLGLTHIDDIIPGKHMVDSKSASIFDKDAPAESSHNWAICVYIIFYKIINY